MILSMFGLKLPPCIAISLKLINLVLTSSRVFPNIASSLFFVVNIRLFVDTFEISNTQCSILSYCKIYGIIWKKYEVMYMLSYCDKCGNTTTAPESSLSQKKCYCCGGSQFKPVPSEYIDDYYYFRFKSKDIEKKFFDEVVKKSPNLDPYLFEHRDEIINSKNERASAAATAGRAISKNQIKCPTCGSTNTNKISGTERAVSVMGLGLFSKKINKSFKCKNCGYTW